MELDVKYRAEIDGLRALAVIPVILFHAGFSFFSGGFVGVDIFFVISGFLITTILADDIEKGRYSILDFYERRIRRILPALVFVISVTYIFSWFWLFPEDFESFSKSVMSVAIFASNIFFWEETGYFETASELKPLLHTWSLAVEEQYYIFFPLFLAFIWKFGKKAAVVSISMMLLFSLMLSEYFVYKSPSASFFLLPTRGWELMIGALCGLYLRKYPVTNSYTSNLLSLAGFILIIVSITQFNKSTPTPSLYTLIPTIGAALIILFTFKGSLAYVLLSNRIFVGIGLISYSAYLWHQPIFALIRHKLVNAPSPLLMLGLSLLSLVFGYISWKFVETPFRKRDAIFNRKQLFTVTIVTLIATFLVGSYGFYTKGKKDRFEQPVLDILYSQKKIETIPSPTAKTARKKTVALLGDSHANSLASVLSRDMYERYGLQLKKYTMSGCPPTPGLYRLDFGPKDTCQKYYKKVYTELLSNPEIKTIIVSARFALYLESTRFDNGQGGQEQGRTERVVYDANPKHSNTNDVRRQAVSNKIYDELTKLADNDKKLFIFDSIPEVGWEVPRRMARLMLNNQPLEITTKKSQYINRNKNVSKLMTKLSQHENIHIVHTENVFCDTNSCTASFNDKPLYKDNNHLNTTGAELLVSYFLGEYNSAFQNLVQNED